MRRGIGKVGYRSVLASLGELAARGVELRILSADRPSRPFRAELSRQPGLARALLLRRCPRLHLKVVIVDGALLYLGSANWTGAGLGARGTGRRNFELGLVTDDRYPDWDEQDDQERTEGISREELVGHGSTALQPAGHHANAAGGSADAPSASVTPLGTRRPSPSSAPGAPVSRTESAPPTPSTPRAADMSRIVTVHPRTYN